MKIRPVRADFSMRTEDERIDMTNLIVPFEILRMQLKNGRGERCVKRSPT